jgi:class 3 adenylate cyclase/tetratricopeptide (TPR) repeat protein
MGSTFLKGMRRGVTGVLVSAFFVAPLLLRSQDKVLKGGPKGSGEAQQADSLEIRALLGQFNRLRGSNPDSAIYVSRKAMELAGQLGFEAAKAEGLKNIGIINFDKGSYQEALDYFNQSLAVYEMETDTVGISNLQNNIGSVYQTIGDNPRALEFFINSLRNGEKVEDTLRMGTAYLNIGTVYSRDKNTYPEAEENYQRSIDLFEKIGYDIGVAVANINFGELYLFQEQPRKALPVLRKALNGFKEIGLDPSPPLNFMGQAYLKDGQLELARQLYEEALRIAREKNNISEETKALIGLGKTAIENRRYAEGVNHLKKGLELANETKVGYDLAAIYENLSEAYVALNDYRNAYAAQREYSSVQDSIRSNDYETQMGNLRVQFGLENAERENELLKAQNNLNALQIEKDARAKQLLYVILGLFVAIIAGFIFQFFYVRRSNRRLAFERNRSEQILLNILPKETADELKEHGFIKAKEFEQITVLFTDFKAFSLIAERISADKLVKSVDYYFKNFDAITERHHLEKIKTIGDAYMCAGGIPSANSTHARDAMKAALEILQFVKDTELDPPPGIYPFKIRLGMNSGPVVAGVVGTRKFAYDIWGNTVNIAARMESGSIAGRINVSENTYKLLKDEFEFTYRGEMEVKNGKVLKMYFAEVKAVSPA